MNKKVVLLLLGLAFVAGTIACTKLGGPPPAGALRVDEPDTLDSIPLEYGNLIAVTGNEPYLALLWFEKPDKTIALVRVNYVSGTMMPIILTIPRR